MLPPLYIGRFQPFHLGHLDAIEQILAKHKHVIIGIGSAQYSGQEKNPYSADMRQLMIEQSLTGVGLNKSQFTVVQIPDIHDNELWVAHVEKLCQPFGQAYSGTPLVQELFQKDSKHTVIAPIFNYQISATEIREKMLRGEKWEDMVPTAVYEIIRQHKQ
ncbi:MAG: nicotinamide-nucleotide adenylyltransferase [Patescibacteria group bacterium]